MFIKKPFPTFVISTTALYLFSSATAAQTADLEPLMVTATRTPTSLNKIGNSVSLITRQEIEQKQYQTLADALKSVVGLTVVELGGRGSQTSVFSRGTNSNHTLVLVDGIEINDPSSPTGSFDFANFLLDDIESIDIVRGSQSVLYGADAIGAVIQIHTQKGHGQLKAKTKLAMGNHSTAHETLHLSGSSGAFNYSVSSGLFESDGDSVIPKDKLSGSSTQDDEGYRNKLFSARLGMTLSKQFEASIFSRHIETNTEIDGFLTEDSDAYNTSRQTYSGAELKGQLFSGLWQPTLLLTHTAVQRNNHNTRISTLDNADHSRYIGEKTKASLQNDLYLNDAHTITVGYEYEKDRLDAKGQSIFGGMFGDFIINQQSDASRQNRAIYIQDQLSLTEQLNLSAGVRYDNTDDFSSETTYKITANYVLDEENRTWASYGTGFRAPSLYELYGYSPTNFATAYFGNPNLDPETSQSWELGLEQSWLTGRLKSNIIIFNSNIDDLITTYFFPSFSSTSINQNEADIYGLESGVTMKLTQALDVKLEHTFTRTKDDDGRELVRRPKHQAHLNFNYQMSPKLNFGTSINYMGSRKDIDENGQRLHTGGYSLVNAVARYEVLDSVKFFARIDNLLDKNYQPAYGYQATGLSTMIGVEISYR